RDIGGAGGTNEYQFIPTGIGASLFTRAFFGPDVSTDVILMSLTDITATKNLKYAPPPDAPALDSVRIGSLRPVSA
ncbi:hypothetical protein AB0301_16750, partial [Microbacterium profundi]